MKRVLFISGHPDDHLTAAGFLHILKKQDYELFEIVLTSGSGGYKKGEEKNKIEETRAEEFKKASELLKMKKTYYLGYDEHTLIMNKENVEEITKIVREINPEIIIIPNRDDYHETHIETNKIATKAIRTAMKVRKLELGKPVQPLMVLEWEHSVPKQPEVVIDITREWDFKKELMKCYGSQLNDLDWQKTKGLNQYRGASIGVKYAEGFKINRFIPMRLDAILNLQSRKINFKW